MKSFKAFLVVLALMVLIPLAAHATNLDIQKGLVDQADSFQAMALANQWKWNQNTIKTYVTPQEVVFEFSDRTTKKVALPADKMVIAIAPYLTYTHE